MAASARGRAEPWRALQFLARGNIPFPSRSPLTVVSPTGDSATVFSRTLDSVQANARLGEASLAEEAAAALDATDKDVGIGGAGLAAVAIELDLVDELKWSIAARN